MKISVEVVLPVDHNGMVTRQCHNEKCRKVFKVKNDDYAEFQNRTIWCPYCGIEEYIVKMNTDEQIQQAALQTRDELMDVADNTFKEMEARSKPNSSIQFRSSHGYTKPQMKKLVEKELKKTTYCKKCSRSISVDFEPLFCPFCKSEYLI